MDPLTALANAAHDLEAARRVIADAQQMQTDCGINGDTDPRWDVAGRMIIVARALLSRASSEDARRQAIEECAKVAEAIQTRAHTSPRSSYAEGWADAGNECIEAIRALSPPAREDASTPPVL